MTGGRPRAVVTGASRGIGKASAIALAAAGFDVAITGRTVLRTDRTYEPSGRLAEPLPGSLEETAEAISAAGGTAHPVRLDLGDLKGLVPAAEACLTALGGVDVVVNNAVWSGLGGYQKFLDTEPADVTDRIVGNLIAQLDFMRPLVRYMVNAGAGTLMNMTSGAAYAPPFAQPGEGGWGLGYTVSKGGFHRIAVQLAFEYAAEGLVAFNLQPGFVATERVKLLAGPVANVASAGAAPSLIGRVVAHIATNTHAFESGSTLQLQDIAKELGRRH